MSLGRQRIEKCAWCYFLLEKFPAGYGSNSGFTGSNVISTLKVVHVNVQDHDGRSSVNLCSDSGCRVVFSPSNSRFGKVVTHFLIPLPKEMPGQSSGCRWPSRIDLHPDKGRDSLSCQMTWYSWRGRGSSFTKGWKWWRGPHRDPPQMNVGLSKKNPKQSFIISHYSKM